MSLSLGRFQPGDIVVGKIIQINSKSITVDFGSGYSDCISISELSLQEISDSKEAVELGTFREFITVGNYNGKSEIFFSSGLLQDKQKYRDRLYEIVLQEASHKYNYPVKEEDIILHTKILDKSESGVSQRIYWFLSSKKHHPTVSFSIRQLEKQIAWERLRQIYSERVILYGEITNKVSNGGTVKVEGILGLVRVFPKKQKDELTIGSKIPLEIQQVREEYNHLVLIPKKMIEGLRSFKINQAVIGTIVKVKNYGLLVDIDDKSLAFLPASNISNLSIPINQVFQVNQRLEAIVAEVDIKLYKVVLKLSPTYSKNFR